MTGNATDNVLWVVNASTLVDDTSAQAMCDAVAVQLVRDICPEYGLAPVCLYYAGMKPASQAGRVILLLDSSDDPGLVDALGAHWETSQGQIVGVVLAKPVLDAGGDLLTGPITVSSVLSHECAEGTVNPTVNGWYDAPDGYEYRAEICDPVEGDSYPGPQAVMLSNFVRRAWFDESPPPGTSTDFLGNLNGQTFTVGAGGYAERRTSSTDETSVTGSRKKEILYGPLYPEWRKAMKEALRHPNLRGLSRASRRIAA